MATCVDVAGAAYLGHHNGNPITPLEGESFAHVFSETPAERGDIFWEHEGNRAVRENEWKLVLKKNQPRELHNMDEDRSELNNLAAQHPDRVAKMAAAWNQWAKRCQVLPQPKDSYWR